MCPLIAQVSDQAECRGAALDYLKATTPLIAVGTPYTGTWGDRLHGCFEYGAAPGSGKLHFGTAMPGASGSKGYRICKRVTAAFTVLGKVEPKRCRIPFGD